MKKFFILTIVPLLFVVGGCTTSQRSKQDAETAAALSALDERVTALEDVSHLPHDPKQRIRMPR